MHDPSLSHSLPLLGCFCDSHKAYPVWSLRALRAVNDRIADKDIVIVSSAVSSDARVYERDGREFLLPPVANAFNGRPSVLVDKDGETWMADETALLLTSVSQRNDILGFQAGLPTWSTQRELEARFGYQ